MNGLVKKFKSIFDPSSPEAELLEQIDPNKLPRHIAVIMARELIRINLLKESRSRPLFDARLVLGVREPNSVVEYEAIL